MDQEARRERIENYLALVLRLTLAGLFLWSAGHKVLDPMSFLVKVHDYQILPDSLEKPFAYLLPWAMLASAVFLILGLLTRVAAAGQTLMLISFLAAIGVNIYRDRVLGCGCFSEEGHPIGWWLMVQDCFLILLAGYLAARGGKKFSLDRLVWKRPGPSPIGDPGEHIGPP